MVKIDPFFYIPSKAKHSKYDELLGRVYTVKQYNRFVPTKSFTNWTNASVVEIEEHLTDDNIINILRNRWMVKKVGDIRIPYIFETVTCEVRGEKNCSGTVTNINNYGNPYHVENRILKNESIYFYFPEHSQITETKYVSRSYSYHKRLYNSLPKTVTVSTNKNSPKKISEAKYYYDAYTSSSQHGSVFKAGQSHEKNYALSTFNR